MIKYQGKSDAMNNSLTFLEFLASVVFIYFVSVTFGASLFENYQQTLFFSFFMGVLCVAPCIILFEHSDIISLFIRLFIKQEFFDESEYRCARISVFSVVGAWFGALVIPLDWDRWWQEWPISCCIGAIMGAFLGVLRGKRPKVKARD